MSKFSKIIIVSIILLLCSIPVLVQATDVNMNLTSPTNTNAVNETTTVPATTDMAQTPETVTESLTPQSDYSNPTTTVSTQNDTSAELGIGNVLNIILIVIGVLLILLGVAIIIRLKR